MSVIETMDWDSEKLGVRVGVLRSFKTQKICKSYDKYDLVYAKVPFDDMTTINRLIANGFEYICQDILLVDRGELLERQSEEIKRLHYVKKRSPDFSIAGFKIEYSRLMLDSSCKEKLPENFWDKVIEDHCKNFAEVVICCADKMGKLTGFSSCIKRDSTLNIFLFGVHPEHRRKGIGRTLIQGAKWYAYNRGLQLTTNVIASNIEAFRFYSMNGFIEESKEAVLHRWRQEA